jgi:hypothetical protein
MCYTPRYTTTEEALPMDTNKQWKKIEHRLSQALARLAEAEALMEELPNTDHITGNFVPVREGIERFRSLASDKVVETTPEPSPVKAKIKKAAKQ